MKTVIFQTASFNVAKNGALTETQFVDKYKSIDGIFNNFGEKKIALLKEAYKVVKHEYDKQNKPKETKSK